MITGPEIIKQVLMGKIVIEPFNVDRVGPNSYDLTLSNKLLKYPESVREIDIRKQYELDELTIPDSGLYLEPDTLYLGSTQEKTGSSHFVPCLHGRSSAARVGLSAHIAAGLGDVGWIGQWTLEITVPHKVKIYPGISVCQVTFHFASGLKMSYGGKYQGQDGATASKIWMDKLRSYRPTQFPILVEQQVFDDVIGLCDSDTTKIAYVPWDKRYCVSDMGDVISLIRTPKKLSVFYRNNNYPLVQIAGKTKITVHRLVAAAFLGPPYKDGITRIVRHLDDNQQNCSLKNLKYGTEKDNADDAKKNGKTYPGELNHNSKLSEVAVLEIRESRAKHKTKLSDLAKEYGVCEETIRRILSRAAWSHIDDGLGNLLASSFAEYLSDEEKSDVDQRLLTGESRKSIADDLGVPKRVIHHRAQKLLNKHARHN